jgi:hypothetical protein
LTAFYALNFFRSVYPFLYRGGSVEQLRRSRPHLRNADASFISIWRRLDEPPDVTRKEFIGHDALTFL